MPAKSSLRVYLPPLLSKAAYLYRLVPPMAPVFLGGLGSAADYLG